MDKFPCEVPIRGMTPLRPPRGLANQEECC